MYKPIQQVRPFLPVLRISTEKQGKTGDSPEKQLEDIKDKARQLGVELTDPIEIWESASKTFDQPFSEIVERVIAPDSKYSGIFIAHVNRFSRAGSEIAMRLVDKLRSAGKEILDVGGVFSNERINLLESEGFEYPWSIRYPNRQVEKLELDRASMDAKDTVFKLISPCLRYTQLGYTVRGAPYGLMNTKIDT